MKKQYISPCIFMVNVKLNPMMGSSLDPGKSGDQVVIPDSSEPAPSEFTSRPGMWDDDDF